MEMTNGIPAFFYPTSVVLVDDSERFLKTFSVNLDSRLAYVSFSNPVQALKYIEKNCAKDDLLNQCLLENSDANNFGLLTSEYDVKVDLSGLYQQIYNPLRFNEVTAVVVDYSMPGMNGTEFCTKLRKINPDIKIILLTGEADEGRGIEMFNTGLIDKFVLKGSERYGEYVNGSILELQKLFFENQSNTLVRNLSSKSISCLKNEAFIKIFYEICKKYDISEYYLIESAGSFFALKFDGSPLWVLVCSDHEFEEYYDIAQDSKASEAVLKLLQDRKKIPYFKNPDEYMKVSGMQWEAYLHPAKSIQGDAKKYYYSVVKDTDLFEIKKQNILSYRDYLENEWPPI